MARRKTSASSPTPIPIGNCEVSVEAKNFSIQADPNSLQISLSKSARIRISVTDRKNSNDLGDSKSGGKEEGKEISFMLLNPKDTDSRSRPYLEEVLKMYVQELPAMNYAANTGKQSMFLERCVKNGKYCTLLLKSNSLEVFGEALAAITYQIIPADTRYAEIPLAAVRSSYQHKGLGSLLYMELRRRLQSVGIGTVFCWGDKESEGFWLKQGFISIAEVDAKGKARRLPVKADIRRALCFPGGSTLMVSHLTKDYSDHPADSLKLCLPLKHHEKGSSDACGVQHLGPSINEDIPTDELMSDELSIEDNNLGECRNKVTGGGYLSKKGAASNVEHCSCSKPGAKRRVWEASLSSLKSKKVKGSHSIDCQADSSCGIALGSDESDESDYCFRGCSLENSKDKSPMKVTPRAPFSHNWVENIVEEHGSGNVPKASGNRDFQSKGKCVRIMLMNIADDAKRNHLTKVIEDLGGAVVSNGSLSTHVVTGKVRKTLNFCTALSSGAWIVLPSWLKESFREGRFVDELPFILKDEEYTMKYRAELKCAVLRAKASPQALLKGYCFCISTHVQPPTKTLSAIVRSAGGEIIWGLDQVNEPSKTVFIACEDNMEEVLLAVKKGVWTFSSDWLMNCIMRQEVDLEAPQFAVSL